MGNYKDIVYSLPEEPEIMEHLTVITDEFIESVRITHPQKYNNFIDQVKKISSSHHFNEETLKETDNHVPKHFSIFDTTKFAQEEFDIDFCKEHFNKYDLNFVINEMYKIFNSVYGEDINKYMELSLAWLDYHSGKAMKYYKKLYT